MTPLRAEIEKEFARLSVCLGFEDTSELSTSPLMTWIADSEEWVAEKRGDARQRYAKRLECPSCGVRGRLVKRSEKSWTCKACGAVKACQPPRQAPYGSSPEEQEVMRLARELAASGMTQQKIAEELTARGFRSRRGSPISKKAVYLILHREVANV